jgi:hypothetical protein
MTKVTEFSKGILAAVDRDIQDAMKAVAEKHGISFKSRGGRFSSTSYEPKMEFAVIAADGTVEDKAARMFKLNAMFEGVDPNALGKEFISWSGDKYVLTGMQGGRSHKYPFLARSVKNGKTFKFPAAQIAAAFPSPK